MNINKVKSILNAANQLQLLRYYDELSSTEQSALINQILEFDFSAVNQRYQDCLVSKELNLDKISPIPYYDKEEITDWHDYEQIGAQVVKNGELAIITIAGGNGTRLGFNGPKGSFKLDIAGQKISIFELFLNQIKAANQKYNIVSTWIIMTSNDNYQGTIDFFKQNNFWGYPQDKIIFFKQNALPILDLNGKCLLKSKNEILTGPNGGGDLFYSLKTNGILAKLKTAGIKWVHIASVDNVLLNLIDVAFLGITIANNYQAGTKSYFKAQADLKEFVLTKYNNKPFLLSHKHISEELSNRQSQKKYLFRDVCLHNYLFQLADIERFATIDLPYYKAPRSYDYLDEEGNLVTGKCYKYEKLIFEILSQLDNLCVLRINPEKEFYPLKSMDDYEAIIGLLQNKIKLREAEEDKNEVN